MTARSESQASPRPELAIEQALRARGEIVSTVNRIVRDSGSAEDIVDESLARLSRALSDGECIDNPTGWVHRTALRLGVDHARAWLRRQRPEWLRGVLERRPTPVDPGVLAERAELRERLWVNLLELPEKQREVLVMHQMEGLNYGEVAAHLGISESTARAHAFSARQSLRKKLSDWIDA